MSPLRRLAALLALVVAVLAVPVAAWAHGQLRPGRAAAGATVATVLVVPSEREGHVNSRIALAVPPEFTSRSCRSPVGWTCATSDRGFTWERVTGLVDAEDFDLTMQVADKPGTYLLPLSQTYDDGQTKAFAGPPGRSDEGPVFTVTGEAAASPSPVPVRTTAAASPRPGTSSAPAVRTTATTTPSTVAAPVQSPTARVVASPEPTSSPSAGAAAGLADLPQGRRLEPAASGDGSAALIALLVVGATALAGAVLSLRRRRTD